MKYNYEKCPIITLLFLHKNKFDLMKIENMHVEGIVDVRHLLHDPAGVVGTDDLLAEVNFWQIPVPNRGIKHIFLQCKG